MKIYLATWLEEVSQDEALTNKNAWNRLLSYFFISKRNNGNRDFKQYTNHKGETKWQEQEEHQKLKKVIK